MNDYDIMEYFVSFEDALRKDITTDTGLVAQKTQKPAKNLYASYCIKEKLKRSKQGRDPFGLEKSFIDFTSALRGVNTNPSQAQKEVGNYKMGHIKLNGFDITIENPKGSTRSGIDPNGQQWSVQMPAHYGYFKRSEGTDGDAVDVYVGDSLLSSNIYIVDQIDPVTKEFDEHKVIMGVSTPFEALVLYEQGFSDGKGSARLGAMTPMTLEQFKEWLKGDTTAPVAYQEPLSKDGFIDFTAALTKSSASPQTDVADHHEQTLMGRIGSALSWLSGQAAHIAEAAVGGNSTSWASMEVAIKRRLTKALEPVDAISSEAGEAAANDAAPGLVFSFDLGNKKTKEFLDDYKMNLIQQITNDQRDAIKDIVTKGTSSGESTDKMKRKIRDLIGLTKTQGENIDNYRSELENLSSNALNRGLRDKRFDSTIQKAIDSGEELSADQIDKMVDAYKRKYLDFRASSIARTESIRAANMGARLAMEQIIDDGDYDDSDIERTWHCTHDKRTRDSHREMDGQTVVGMNSEYKLPDGGKIKYPLDQDSDADEVVNCRCWESYKLNKS